MALCLGDFPRREGQDKKVQREVKMSTAPFGKAFDRECTVNRCYSLDLLHIKQFTEFAFILRTRLMA